MRGEGQGGLGLGDLVVGEAAGVQGRVVDPGGLGEVQAAQHVAAGLGVSLVPGSLVGFHAGQIAYRRLYNRVPCLKLVLAWPTAKTSLLTKEFLGCCRAAGQSCRDQLNKALQAG